MNPIPPIDRQTLGDTLRNIFDPTAIFAAIAAVWGVGWASSLEARASLGYWSAINNRSVSESRSDSDSANDQEHQGAVATVSDPNN